MVQWALNRAGIRLTGAIEHAHGLDSLAKPLSRAVARVIPRGPVNELLSGTGAGHPAHPALVLVPLGSWLSVTLLDLVGGPGSRATATRLLGWGNLAVVPAVAAGANDWMDTEGAARRVGLVHALANASALSLFTASWLARRRGQHRAGVTLGAAGMALATGAGWLGGHLAYGLGVGVDTTVFQDVAKEWTEVGPEDQVGDDTPVMVQARGIPVLLARQHGRIYALSDRCTHRGAPLHEGSVADGCVTCPWHGSRFRLEDGSIARGPACRPQPRFEVRVSDGRIQVRPASQTGPPQADPGP